MRLRPNAALSSSRAAVFLLAIFPSCGNYVPGPLELGDSGFLSPAPLHTEPTYVETTANNLLELAERVSMDIQPQVISGEISQGDLDVYDLGGLRTGDRLEVSVEADEQLQGAIALFDENGEVLLINDHRNVYFGRQGPFLDVTARHDSRSAYVAFTSTPGFATSGDYVLAALKEPDQPVPEIRPDRVLLDFRPAQGVRIGNRLPVDIPAFDASSIGEEYAGKSEELMELIVAFVREDFAGFNVAILSTSEGDDPEEGVSRIHFGTFDEALLGIAETVDEFNSESGQHAIVFTDTFAAFARLRPSVEELAQAIANVASHEIGHLEGLVHTDNPDDLMDVTASLRELLLDQDFATSPIYSAVFPIGLQNSVQYLLDAVGGDAAVRTLKAQLRPIRPRSLVAVPRARDIRMLSSCGLSPEGCRHRMANGE